MAKNADKKPFARILKHLKWIATGKGYGAVLSLVYLAIITRSLGPAQYGAFSLILSTTMTLQLVLGFNVWQVLVKYGHEHIQSKDFDALACLIRFCTIIDLLTASLGILVVALILWLGSDALGMTGDLAWQTFGYAVVILLSIRNVPRGMLRLQCEFKLSFMAESVVPTVKFAGSLLAVLIHPSVSTFLWTWAAGELASTLVFWVVARRKFRHQFGRPQGRRWYRAWRENDGLPSLLVATNIGETAYAAGQQLPVLLIGFFAGTAEAGLYRLAHQLTQTLSVIAGFINLASYTEMAYLHAKDGLQKIKPLFIRIVLISLGTAAVLLPVIIFLGKPLLLLMSGPQFLGAYPFLLVLGLAAAMQIVSVTSESLLMAAGRSKTLIAIRLIGTAVLLAMLFVLLNGFGAIGAAWARALTEAISLGLILGACYLILRKVKPAS
ncbi:lipopolysaccharide biosynthesis protein [Sphingobium cupriresistens]|uniref:Lipopolysaccharide biosynthesis protein n=1 Tax=Sphingobium cupriresistens TaxID=1132417 RepID=A0A8G1ZDK8_9SPHN|nr:oligosaccharide flippase family protein [Sphingobium cupriresistens]RYM06395.1 hypothetical protein EWH12_20240 [Sphingobium cupriresistens]